MTKSTRLSQGIIKIHVAKKQLAMNDDDYRAMLQRTAGVASSKQIKSFAKLDAVIDELRRLGFVDKPKGKPNNIDREPLLQKIEALLADMGKPWRYAQSIAERQTPAIVGAKIERLEWVPDAGLKGVIAALSRQHKKELNIAITTLFGSLASIGITGRAATTWCEQQAKESGVNTAVDRPWMQTIQTLTRLTQRVAACRHG